MAAIVTLTAYKRVPFVDEDGATWVFFGEEWDDATFAMHIRAHRGDTGTPVVSLANATAGSQGISATYDPAYVYVDPQTKEDVTGPATLVLVQIDEATLEALSLGTPYDKAIELYYDLHVTPSGMVKRIPVEGAFIVKPGVTI
jgi:hypothetical protein